MKTAMAHKKLVEPRSVRIVALSAFDMKGDAEKAIAAGCDGDITKPINTRTFSAQVLAYLGKE